MSERSLIEIFCEGNEKVGYGHIRRSITLAARLEKDGIDVRVSGLSEDARRMLPVPKHTGREAQVVIFDAPSGIDDQIRIARERHQTTISLDWFGESIPDINIAVYPHGEVRAVREAYVGFEYILVRDEIAMMRHEHPSGRSDRVLILLGGGDLLGQGHNAARYLRDHGYDATLVQGPLAKATEPGVGYRVLVNPSELPQLIASCDWAVTNGGGAFFEAICLGKAAFVLPQTEAEKKIAHFAQEKGAVLGIGLNNLREFHSAELSPVAERGARLVDGRGAERISAIVQGLL